MLLFHCFGFLHLCLGVSGGHDRFVHSHGEQFKRVQAARMAMPTRSRAAWSHSLLPSSLSLSLPPSLLSLRTPPHPTLRIVRGLFSRPTPSPPPSTPTPKLSLLLLRLTQIRTHGHTSNSPLSLATPPARTPTTTPYDIASSPTPPPVPPLLLHRITPDRHFD